MRPGGVELDLQRILAAVALALYVPLLWGCRAQRPAEPEGSQFLVSVGNRSTGALFGLHFEYCVARVNLGGQIVSIDPGMTRPLPEHGRVDASFQARDFPNEAMPPEGRFGIFVSVVRADGGEIPIEYFWEWDAAAGETYRFTLTGSEEQGYTLTPEACGVEYTITPWSELPEDAIS